MINLRKTVLVAIAAVTLGAGIAASTAPAAAFGGHFGGGHFGGGHFGGGHFGGGHFGGWGNHWSHGYGYGWGGYRSVGYVGCYARRPIYDSMGNVIGSRPVCY